MIRSCHDDRGAAFGQRKARGVSELFYRAVRFVGRGVFRVASAPRILHAERAERPGAYLLAANHESVFDAPLLTAATPRVIYWLSITEIFRLRWTAARRIPPRCARSSGICGAEGWWGFFPKAE